MHRVNLDKIAFELPEKQEEVTDEQYQAISHFLLQPVSYEVKVHVLTILMKMQLRKQMRIFSKGYIRDFEVIALADLIAWMWDRQVEDPHQDVVPWVDSFTHQGITYLLPEPSFNDFTMDEWAHVDTHLLMLSHQPEKAEHHILNLTATICRPAKHQNSLLSEDFNGYPRLDFNPETVGRRYEAFKEAPAWVSVAALDYCLRGRQLISKRYAVLFDGDSSDGPGFGWKGLMLNVAEAGVFGMESQVKKTNVHEVLLYCSKKRIEMQQMERKMEEARMRAQMRSR